ncbi:MAG: hypothetical protein MUE40_21005 [Anaerolineae bacterium]|nr:hypothetical protein [Anaerolineae bacterium]
MPEPTRAETMRAEIQDKVKKLIQDFTEGTISSEQFDLIYGRYHNQLALVEQSLYGESYESPVNTVALLDATRARATGLTIYHHRSGTTLETMGKFDLPPEIIAPVLNEISLKLEARQYVEPFSEKVNKEGWVAFFVREFTTVIVLFRNEPARLQMRQLQRLHHDFEEANRRLLDKFDVDRDRPAGPPLQRFHQG